MPDLQKKATLILVVIVVAFAALGVILIRISPLFQDTIAKNLLGNNGLQFESCIANFHSFQLTKLRYKNDFICAFAEKAVFKCSFINLLFGKMKFKELSIPDLKIEFSEENPPIPLESLDIKKICFDKLEIDSVNMGMTLLRHSRNLKAEFVGKNLSFANGLPKSGMFAINSLYNGKGIANFNLRMTIIPKGKNLSLKSSLSSADKRFFQLSANIKPDWTEGDFEFSADYDPANSGKINCPYLSKLENSKLLFYLKGVIRNKEMRARLQFNAESSDACLLDPRLKNIGPFAFSGSLSFNKTPESFDMLELDLRLSKEGTPLAQIKSGSSVSLKFKSPERIKLGILTLSIPSKILGYFASPLKLDSANLMAEYDVYLSSPPSPMLSLKTRTPANLTRLHASKENSPILSGLDLFAESEINIYPRSPLGLDGSLRIFCASSKSSVLNFSTRFKYDTNSSDVRTLGDGTFTFSSKISGELAPLTSKIYSMSNCDTSELIATGETSGRINSEGLKIETFHVLISDRNGEKVLELRENHPVLLGGNAIHSSGEFLQIEANKAPFSILRPLFHDWDADNISFKGSLFADSDSIKLSSDFAINYLNLKRNNALIIKNLCIKGKLTSSLTASCLDFSADDLKWGTSERESAYASIRAKFDSKTKILKNVSFKMHASLPQVFSQPVLKPLENISRGTLELSGKTSPELLNLKARIDNFASRTCGGNIDTLFLDVDAKLDNFKFISANIDTKVNSMLGESSLSAKIFDKEDAVYADLYAKSLVLEDAHIIFSALRNPSTEPSAPVTQKSGLFDGGLKFARPPEAKTDNTNSDKLAIRDSSAFWDAGKNVRMLLKIDTAFFESTPFMSNAKSSFYYNPNNFVIEDFSTMLANSKVELLGESVISFDPKKIPPYELGITHLKITGFDLSNMSDKKGKITGSFDGDIRFHGHGNNALHLFQFLCADAHFKNERGGELQLIGRNSVLSLSAPILEQSVSIASKIANTDFDNTKAFADIIRFLSHVNYSAADFDISRAAPDYNFKIKRANITGNDIALKCNNAIVYFDPNRSFPEQYFDASISIFVARSEILDTFRKLGIGENSLKDDGYVHVTDFKLNGILEDPQNNLFDILIGRPNDGQKDVNKIDFYKMR